VDSANTAKAFFFLKLFKVIATSTMQTIQQYARDLYNWTSQWSARLKTREVGDVCINRWDGKMRREIVPLRKRLAHLVLYSRPMDVLDRWGLVRHLFDTETIHEGHYMRKPSSASQIPNFIEFYKINMNEFEQPDPNSYETFNDFFIRRLKPGMRYDRKKHIKSLSNPLDRSLFREIRMW